MAVDLLWFSASWCGPCKNMIRAGVLEDVQSAGFEVTKIDVDAQRALANEYGIQAMPTMIIRKDAVPVGRLVGARDSRSLIAELKRFEDA